MIVLSLFCGEVVSVTGDGTNDVAAPKQAHVSVSMGSGTAIAKEASENYSAG